MMLDAGCGPRISSLAVVPDSVHCVGVDASFRNVLASHRKARINGYQNFRFVVASIENLPFINGIFDLILCCDVLEHVKRKRSALHEISRVHKPGGTFVGSTTNLLNPIVFFDSFAPRRITSVLTRKFAGAHQHQTYSRFTPYGLLKTLVEMGFERCKVMLFGHPLFQPWIYENERTIKLPWFAFLWIAFDNITHRRQLRLFKETLVFCARKNQSVG